MNNKLSMRYFSAWISLLTKENAKYSKFVKKIKKILKVILKVIRDFFMNE